MVGVGWLGFGCFGSGFGVVQLFGDEAAEVFIFDALAPEIVPLFLILGPGGLGSVPVEGFIDVGLETLVEELFGVVEAVLHAVHEPFICVGGEADVAFAQLFVELGGVGCELVDIALKEVTAGGVEGFEVAVEGVGGDVGVEGELIEVKDGEGVGYGSADTVNV